MEYFLSLSYVLWCFDIREEFFVYYGLFKGERAWDRSADSLPSNNSVCFVLKRLITGWTNPFATQYHEIVRKRQCG